MSHRSLQEHLRPSQSRLWVGPTGEESVSCALHSLGHVSRLCIIFPQDLEDSISRSLEVSIELCIHSLWGSYIFPSRNLSLCLLLERPSHSQDGLWSDAHHEWKTHLRSTSLCVLTSAWPHELWHLARDILPHSVSWKARSRNVSTLQESQKLFGNSVSLTGHNGCTLGQSCFSLSWSIGIRLMPHRWVVHAEISATR